MQHYRWKRARDRGRVRISIRFVYIFHYSIPARNFERRLNMCIVHAVGISKTNATRSKRRKSDVEGAVQSWYPIFSFPRNVHDWPLNQPFIFEVQRIKIHTFRSAGMTRGTCAKLFECIRRVTALRSPNTAKNQRSTASTKSMKSIRCWSWIGGSAVKTKICTPSYCQTTHPLYFDFVDLG